MPTEEFRDEATLWVEETDMAFVYINHGSRPDVKIGSHEGENPDARRRHYGAERGVLHERQFAVPVPKGTAERIERLVHVKLRSPEFLTIRNSSTAL